MVADVCHWRRRPQLQAQLCWFPTLNGRIAEVAPNPLTLQCCRLQILA